MLILNNYFKTAFNPHITFCINFSQLLIFRHKYSFDWIGHPKLWLGLLAWGSALSFNDNTQMFDKIVFNSLAPGGFENIFQNVFFKLISWIDTLSNSCETALRSMPQNTSDDKSTLVQVMAWCRQAASHYLSQCCPRSLSPYGVTRPQWVKHCAKIMSLFRSMEFK